MQVRKSVWLCASGLMLKRTSSTSRRWRSVATACGVSGPSRTEDTSAGPSAQSVSSSPAHANDGERGGGHSKAYGKYDQLCGFGAHHRHG